jgi:hypothetical protein
VDVTDEHVEEALVEMAYRWGDIEGVISSWVRRRRGAEDEQVGARVADALRQAFRVEAQVEEGEDDFGNPWASYDYVAFFDVEQRDSRDGAQVVRDEVRFLENVIAKLSGGERRNVQVRVTAPGTPATGEVCGRPFEPKPKKHLDVTDVPIEKPESNVPLTQRDTYWLTPIEVPFYDALRETGAIFAVQPWIQGVESRYRPDFMIFYDGGMVVVELDGHESHKTREQRTRDARRQRWFEGRGIRVLRWTGSEVHTNAQSCVRELLEIVRGKQARF